MTLNIYGIEQFNIDGEKYNDWRSWDDLYVDRGAAQAICDEGNERIVARYNEEAAGIFAGKKEARSKDIVEYQALVAAGLRDVANEPKLLTDEADGPEVLTLEKFVASFDELVDQTRLGEFWVEGGCRVETIEVQGDVTPAAPVMTPKGFLTELNAVLERFGVFLSSGERIGEVLIQTECGNAQWLSSVLPNPSGPGMYLDQLRGEHPESVAALWAAQAEFVAKR
jgi:hypothetical protein